MEIDEYYGSMFYNKYDRNGTKIFTPKNSTKLSRILNAIMMIFLPQGYPHSVSKDYLHYQLWDSLQAYCSTISGSLAMQAVLKGSGVGDENASVVAATITWILKDGTGMVGRIWFAWWKSISLDANCKRWRLFADVLNDVSIYIDICAAMWISQFRVFSCIAAFSRALVGVAGGATRSSITQHQALRHNTADVSAKDGSQETLVNLFGLISSIIILPYFTNTVYVLTLLTALTIIHLYANYKAVSTLEFNTLNRERFHHVFTNYMRSNSVGSIAEANRREMLIFSRFWTLKINFGCSFLCLINNIENFHKIDDLIDIFKEKKYILNINIKNGCVYVIFKSDASARDYIMAYYHFEYLNFMHDPSSNSNQASRLHILRDSLKFVNISFDNFLSKLSDEGWKTDVAWLCQDEWTFELPKKNN